MVMTAHISLPAFDSVGVPATLSPKIITGLLRDTMHFKGVTVTDAMTMEGVGKGYTTEQSSVLAIKAGADILLKPTDATRAIDAVLAAVERGEISRSRIDSAARRILELKARAGLDRGAEVSLTHLRDVVGSPEHHAIAADVANRAITLLRNDDNLVPLKAAGNALLVQYMPETEIRAGRILSSEIVKGRAGKTITTKISPGATADMLKAISGQADAADAVVIAAYVRRVEGEGRFAVPQPIAAWIDSIAQRRPTIVVAFGNPYLLRQFPSVKNYMVTYGVGDDLERAASAALLGKQAITGRTPVGLPGFFKAGDGIRK
jgi:beta-N-acetylhexosaminidase